VKHGLIMKLCWTKSLPRFGRAERSLKCEVMAAASLFSYPMAKDSRNGPNFGISPSSPFNFGTKARPTGSAAVFSYFSVSADYLLEKCFIAGPTMTFKIEIRPTW
jgi:hypothetical protein